MAGTEYKYTITLDGQQAVQAAQALAHDDPLMLEFLVAAGAASFHLVLAVGDA